MDRALHERLRWIGSDELSEIHDLESDQLLLSTGRCGWQTDWKRQIEYYYLDHDRCWGCDIFICKCLTWERPPHHDANITFRRSGKQYAT